jgi:hypothetical protein
LANTEKAGVGASAAAGAQPQRSQRRIAAVLERDIKLIPANSRANRHFTEKAADLRRSGLVARRSTQGSSYLLENTKFTTLG